MLKVKELETGYDQKQVLYGVSLAVYEGEIVALIGPNGAGKSTILKAVSGLLKPWRGQIRFDGTVTNGSTPARNVRRGITFCPQGNRVFDELSVRENLEVGGCQLSRRELRSRIAEVLELFPVLRERSRQSAGRLSGGEQQMLSFARALVPRPKLLMLDEPSLGLAPGLVKSLFLHVSEISRQTGTAILIVEQKVREVLAIADRVYLLRLGRIAFDGRAKDLQTDSDRLRDLFL